MKRTTLVAAILAALAAGPASGEPDCRSSRTYRTDCGSSYHYRDHHDYHHHGRDYHRRNDDRRPYYDSKRRAPLAKPNPPFQPKARGWTPPK